MKIKQAWKLPVVFLVGYLFAWGMILVDRQMIIDEQKALSQAMSRLCQELKLRKLVEEFGSDWQEMVIWNEEEKQEPPEEVGK